MIPRKVCGSTRLPLLGPLGCKFGRVNGIIILLIGTLVLFPIKNPRAAETQHWNDSQLNLKWRNNLSLLLYNRLKFSEVLIEEAYTTAFQLGPVYKLSRTFTISAAYRYDVINRHGYYEFENRFFLQYSLRLAAPRYGALDISQRSELRYFTRRTEDHIRLRLRASLSRNMKLGRMKITPYCDGEIFFDDIDDKINRFRLYFGALLDLGDQIALKLGWIKQFDEASPDIDILNTGFNIAR